MVLGWVDLSLGVVGQVGSRDPQGEWVWDGTGSFSPPAGSLKCPPGRHRGSKVHKF